jgi:hypothetical protein
MHATAGPRHLNSLVFGDDLHGLGEFPLKLMDAIKLSQRDLNRRLNLWLRKRANDEPGKLANPQRLGNVRLALDNRDQGRLGKIRPASRRRVAAAAQGQHHKVWSMGPTVFQKRLSIVETIEFDAGAVQPGEKSVSGLGRVECNREPAATAHRNQFRPRRLQRPTK